MTSEHVEFAGSNAFVHQLEEEIAELYLHVNDATLSTRKQDLYNRVGQFLLGSFQEHWWCTYPTLMTFITRILELYPGPQSVQLFYNRMKQQLSVCKKCVDRYHDSFPNMLSELENEFTSESIDSYFELLANLDIQRLQHSLREAEGDAKASFRRFDKSSIARAVTTLYEILSHRRLYSDIRVVRLLSKWLASVTENFRVQVEAESSHFRGCTGLYYLLVSPEASVRAWATLLLGKVQSLVLVHDGPDSHLLQVLQEWMYILENEAFQKPLCDMELDSVKALQVFMQAEHGVTSPTPQILWAALDVVMQRFDEQNLEFVLEHFDTFPDLVLNYLTQVEPNESNQQLTFLIAKCFSRLLLCLRHLFWHHTIQSPRLVLETLLQHCRNLSWKTFVLKQLIQVLSTFLNSIRPIGRSQQRSSTQTHTYFSSRDKLLRFLIDPAIRPIAFETDKILFVAVSKAVSSIILDCYEACASTMETDTQPKEIGSLEENNVSTFEVVGWAQWWPCDLSDSSNFDSLSALWMNYFFRVVANPKNVPSLVDHVAFTCSVVLKKHLQLARNVVYASVTTGVNVEEIMDHKPIDTDLLKSLCAYESVASIPVVLHGALFENLGGVSELRNLFEANKSIKNPSIASPSDDLTQFMNHHFAALEQNIYQYFTRILEEILTRGLTNPLVFPVVTQHVSLCLLNPNEAIEQGVKRLLSHADRRVGHTLKPTTLESFLVLIHRQPEAFLRGVLVYLQQLRSYIFSWMLSLPTIQKLFFLWSKAFELDGPTLTKVLTDTRTQLGRLSTLMNDFLVETFTAFQDHLRFINEITAVRIVDFVHTFWSFWVGIDFPGSAITFTHKRNFRILRQLAQLLQVCLPLAVKCRVFRLIRFILEACVTAHVPLEEDLLCAIERIPQAEMKNESADLTHIVSRLRGVTKRSEFFARNVSSGSSSRSKPEKPKSSPGRPAIRARIVANHRPVCGSKAQGKKTNALVDYDVAKACVSSTLTTKKDHSFYDEGAFQSETKPEQAKTRPKDRLCLDKVLRDIAQTHQSSKDKKELLAIINARGNQRVTEKKTAVENELLDLATTFRRIKQTQKGNPISSLFPFYRNLLQQCLPIVWTKRYEKDEQARGPILQSPPLKYRDPSHYVHSFLPLLLEECAYEMGQQLSKFPANLTPKSAQTMRFEFEKRREGMRCLHFEFTQKNGAESDRKSRQTVFRNGDLILLRKSLNAKDRVRRQASTEILGVILITEADKVKRRTSRGHKPSSEPSDKDLVKVLFLPDNDMETLAADADGVDVESVSTNALAESEWLACPLLNLVTASREYAALRSVDLLPEHLRTAILTPDALQSAPMDLEQLTSELEALRAQTEADETTSERILAILERLTCMDITLENLRVTKLGKLVNRLRKNNDQAVVVRAEKLKKKWKNMLQENVKSVAPPKFCSELLWMVIRKQYNTSQLQSIANVLNNYKSGISLLQGPPGTGKTRTIMGLLSCFLSLKPELEKENRPAYPAGGAEKAPVFAVSGKSIANHASIAGVLKRNDSHTTRLSIQTRKNLASARGNLDRKLKNPSSITPGGSFKSTTPVIHRRSSKRVSGGCNLLLCAPSNGAVDELVLRIVTDGLLDTEGQTTHLNRPSMDTDASKWTIVRLGSAGEDAPEAVKAVCLPHILEKEMRMHPKAMQLQRYVEEQAKLREAIRAFHANKTETISRKELSRLHTKSTECFGRIRRMREELRNLESTLTLAILNKANIIACTLSKAGSGMFSSLPRGFDALVIDEAAQAVELSALIPIRERVARVILVGDPKQLPATVKSSLAAQARYDRSLFERLVECGLTPSMLRVQYRMHPFMREFPSDRFYDGQLTDGSAVLQRMRNVRWNLYEHLYFQPFLLYHVETSSEESVNGSKCNRDEAKFCVDLCVSMLDEAGRNGAPRLTSQWSIGFVSPYKEQVHALRRQVQRSVLSQWLATSPNAQAAVSVEVNTVDGFQGREKDMIVFSSVRSSSRGGIGFLRDIRRLNVAITRARYCLFVVGNTNTLKRDRTWAAFVKSAEDRQLVVDTRGLSFQSLIATNFGHEGLLRKHYKTMHEELAKKHASVLEVDQDIKQVPEEAVKSGKKRKSQVQDQCNGPQDSTGNAYDSITEKQFCEDKPIATKPATGHPLPIRQPKKTSARKMKRTEPQSGNMLSNILGSVSQLTSATSKVQEHTGHMELG
uniref:ATPdependent helicase putative n=1 Tax=Albugo laibachii Nc14 TaxID=890382 RepID=F0WQJ9_9STRA|nr:ATPdependent helicase putative [Albugo laibachii Nc14]CCA24157.1 ATPdependent helicase putative [Albugo laibachii Nc14]|eukprot:CCA24157.1 ATPdependent helicase putative [Albugo laibachii Nc14]